MTRKDTRSGMTLIELMVSIGVATLVFSAAVSVYLVVTSSLRRQQADTQSVACAVLEQLRHDLTACAQSASTNMPAFVLDCPAHDTNSPGFSDLAFSTGRTPSPDDDFSRLEIERIHYSVQSADGQLIRETQPLSGANALAPAVSNIVMQGVTAFEVSVLPDTTWTNVWQSSARTVIPHAARIRLDWQTSSTSATASVDVFIPAGNPVSAPAPAPAPVPASVK